jgi:diguanylate cyclase (GGDEF)-like protein
MVNSAALFLLIPAMYALFALSLALIALFERRMMSARWAALGFALASVSIATDWFRVPGELSWLLWMGAITHYAALLAMIAAFLSRHDRTMPRLALAIAALAAVLLLPEVPWTLAYEQRSVAMIGLGAAIVFSAIRALRTAATNNAIDRLVYFATLAAGLSYFVRTMLALINLVSTQLPEPAISFGTLLMVFHISGALTGFLVGIVLMLSIGYDMLALKTRESETDPLTGLWNRRRLEALLGDDAGTDGAVIVIDLDHFKLINDRFGHDAGDEVLRRVGRTLDGLLSPFGTVCRVGGEEFVALIHAPSAEAASALAIAAREALAAITFDRPLDAVRITASVGYCQCSGSINARDAIRFADQAVYAAKADGRDRVVGAVFSGGLQVLKAVA